MSKPVDRAKSLKRRQFLATAGAAAAASTIAAPAIAQSMPELKWRLASSFPKSLDTLYGGAEQLSKRVAEATDNKFQIRVFAAGEIVPGLQVLDATQNGTVEMAHTASYYFVGKDPCFCLDSSLPFGMNARQQAAWWHHGGGAALMREFYTTYNTYPIPAGNTGTQMGGWFRKEIKTPKDLEGLKMRIGGIAGQVLQKVGVVPQQLAGGDIYPALEKGTIDAAEWVGPYDDEKLGFNKVAKYYYYPGWWEGGTQISAYVGLPAWNSLTPTYKAILESACAEAGTWITAKYDAQNPDAIKRLIAGGAELRPFSAEVLDVCYKAAQELWADISTKNANFKKIHDSYAKFLDLEYEWFQVAETTYDNFMVRATRAARAKR